MADISIQEKRRNYIKMILPVRLREYLTDKHGASRITVLPILRAMNAGYKSITIVQCALNVRNADFPEVALMNALKESETKSIHINDEIKNDVTQIVKKVMEESKNRTFE